MQTEAPRYLSAGISENGVGRLTSFTCLFW
jgi:hypothetical protein